MLGGSTGIFNVFFYMAPAMREHKKQTDFDAHLMATPAGKMALQTYDQCMKSGGLISGAPTSAACVIQTVNAAKALSGEQFSIDVSTALKSKLESAQEH